MRCNACGRFVDCATASIKQVSPDSALTPEEWDILCHKCKEKENEKTPRQLKFIWQ